MRRSLRWVTSLFGARADARERQEQDLKDELAFHFNTEVERRVAIGQSPADALVSAKRDFGNVPLVEDVTRDMWGWWAQDYKLGIRMLVEVSRPDGRRRPGAGDRHRARRRLVRPLATAPSPGTAAPRRQTPHRDRDGERADERGRTAAAA